VPSGVAVQSQGGFEYLAVGFDIARPPYGAALDCMNIDHEISSSFVWSKTRGCVDNVEDFNLDGIDVDKDPRLR